MRTELCSKTAHPLSPFYPERGQCRAVRFSESVETPEGTFAERHGCARIDAELHTPGRAYFPRRAIYKRRRAVGIEESLESPEGAFAVWRGYTVTYPTEYKRLRAAFPCSALRRVHRTIGSNEGLARGYRILPSLLWQRDRAVPERCRRRCVVWGTRERHY
jgi:hypothetical protein